MENALHNKTNTEITNLYDRLESYLRALETLGRTKDKFADFLTPVVESCLPDKLLRLWQRSRDDVGREEDNTAVLNRLMNFLRREVEGEERISIVKEGFGCKKRPEGTIKREFKNKSKEATAAALMNTANKGFPTERRDQCAFRGKTHNSSECFSARKMTEEEKRQALQEGKRCFVCLRTGHRSQQCRAKISCILCRGRHCPVLCRELKPEKTKTAADSEKVKPIAEPKKADNDEVIKDSVLSAKIRKSEVILQTIVIRVRAHGREILVRCVLDTGSQRSYIAAKIVKQLNLTPIGTERVIHGLFGGGLSAPAVQHLYKVEITSLCRDFSCSFDMLGQEIICGEIPVLSHEEIRSLEIEEGLVLPQSDRAPLEIGMLLGADTVGRLMTGVIKETKNGLTAVHTRLGWTIMGLVRRENNCSTSLLTFSLLVRDWKSVELWSLDTLGIKDPIVTLNGKMRFERVLKEFQETIEVNQEGRYQVKLPFKEDHVELADCKALAWQRHRAMINRLTVSGLIPEYSAVFDDWEAKHMIEEVPSQDIRKQAYYLPHRPVLKINSTTKIRPVFDASARAKGEVSLNECLEKGINLLELIPEILDRFRKKAVGLTADIEKAFLQLEVNPEQRDFLRFFHPNGREYRHCRVVFGVNSSPFLLGAVLNHHLNRMKKCFPKTVGILERSFYVDNLVTSVDSRSELLICRQESILLMEKAKMNLRCWASNVDLEEKSSMSAVPMLGLIWNTKNDSLRCDVSRIRVNGPYTKRKILSITQQVFDPIGLVCPCLLLPKKLIQEAWLKNLGWDEPLPEDLNDKFNGWSCNIKLLNEIEMPRRTYTGNKCQIHVFADASKQAYGVCIFARYCNEQQTKVSLVRAKSRLAPKGDVIIARAELMACALAARLAKSVIDALTPFDFQIRYWTDSTISLWWIKEASTSDVFVKNRIREIHTLSSKADWYHIPGQNNPADLLSRGCSIPQLKDSRWWEGPAWLSEDESKWPVGFEINRDNISIQSNVLFLENNILTPESKGNTYVNPFKDVSLSNFRKIVRVVAWTNRFIVNCKLKQNRNKANRLSFTELKEAESMIWRSIQREVYGKNKKSFPLEIFIDSDGVARVKLQIINRSDSKDFLFPILVPSKHKFTLTLIRTIHVENCHVGFNMLWSLLRRQYWIIGARRAIKQIIRQCAICRRITGETMQGPPAVLPLTRVRDAAVFETVGVDLAGPLILKKGQKAWIVLFTCAVYRAIHLEMVCSLSADAFTQSFRRFVARRGRVIYSDNGTNFRRTAHELAKVDWQHVLESEFSQGIEWKFNVPSAPWWGGWWERIIRIIKELLRKTLGRASLNYEEMYTALCETEAVVNARPLTYLSEEDKLIPLTPATFMQDIPDFNVPDIEPVDAQRLRRRVVYRRRIAQELRMRFRNEYLSQLKMTQKKKPSSPQLQQGEVVLIADTNKKRVLWPLARVIKILPGNDGNVRCAELQTSKGTLLRPVQRLIRLEMPDAAYDIPHDVGIEEKDSLNDNIRRGGKTSDGYRTRSGRLVKTPIKLDLLNQIMYKWKVKD